MPMLRARRRYDRVNPSAHNDAGRLTYFDFAHRVV